MVVSAGNVPNGKQQFLDGNGKPYAGGSVYFYVPGTTTFSNTWQDPQKLALNANPVLLDSNGEAVIFGDNQYRQVLKDVNGNQIWDQLVVMYMTMGGDLSGEFPNPSLNPTAVTNAFQSGGDKPVPVANDRFAMFDSANAFAPVYTLWSQIVSTMQTALQTIFDARYALTTAISGGFQQLKVAPSTTSTIVITALALTLANSLGASIGAKNVNSTISLNVSGANGLDTGVKAASSWYHVFEIYNPTTQAFAGLASLSPTAPSLPSGFTYFARVGAVRTDGSSNLWQTVQYGRRAQVTIGVNPATLPVMISGSSGSVSTPTWTAVPVANFVPPTASRVQGILLCNQGDNSGALAAPSNAYGAWNSSTNSPPVGGMNTGITGSNIRQEWVFDFTLESANIYYASNNGGSAIYLMGWEDNL